MDILASLGLPVLTLAMSFDQVSFFFKVPSKVQVSFEQLSDTVVRISWRLSSPNGKILAYYLTYAREDDIKDSKTMKTTKTEVILTGLKLGKTYSFVVRDQFCLCSHKSNIHAIF